MCSPRPNLLLLLLLLLLPLMARTGLQAPRDRSDSRPGALVPAARPARPGAAPPAPADTASSSRAHSSISALPSPTSSSVSFRLGLAGVQAPDDLLDARRGRLVGLWRRRVRRHGRGFGCGLGVAHGSTIFAGIVSSAKRSRRPYARLWPPPRWRSAPRRVTGRARSHARACAADRARRARASAGRARWGRRRSAAVAHGRGRTCAPARSRAGR